MYTEYTRPHLTFLAFECIFEKKSERGPVMNPPSLKWSKAKTSKDIGIRTFEFVVKTQFLSRLVLAVRDSAYGTLIG